MKTGTRVKLNPDITLKLRDNPNVNRDLARLQANHEIGYIESTAYFYDYGVGFLCTPNWLYALNESELISIDP